MCEGESRGQVVEVWCAKMGSLATVQGNQICPGDLHLTTSPSQTHGFSVGLVISQTKPLLNPVLIPLPPQTTKSYSNH